jgi:hypothetical protein
MTTCQDQFKHHKNKIFLKTYINRKKRIFLTATKVILLKKLGGDEVLACW